MTYPKKLLAISVLVGMLLYAQQTQAADLDHGYVRVDRTAASTATTGMVCAKTPSTDNGTESYVSVTFPTGVAVNQSTGAWSVSTTDIPDGASAWPGINTASSVSGQTVIFPSSDLSAGTLYCFAWTSASAVTTASTYPLGSGTIITQTAGHSTIDSIGYTLPVNNDQFNISARVGAIPTDFTAIVTAPGGQPYRQDQEIQYTLTYGSTLPYDVNITIEAEWSMGTVAGSNTPTVEIQQYVPGSASNAYGGATPYVDLANHKIIWNINQLPQDTPNQTVTFKLVTTSTFVDTTPVYYNVRGRTIGAESQSPDGILNRTYVYVPAPFVPGPSATPAPGPTATPTPIPVRATRIREVRLDGVSSDSAAVTVRTSNPTTLTLTYGNTPTNLNHSITDIASRLTHRMSIGGLTPNTNYFFKLEARDNLGRRLGSDIYQFATATPGARAQIDPRSLIITSGGTLLYAVLPSQNDTLNIHNVVVPTNNDLEVHVATQKEQNLKRAQLVMRSSNTLAAESGDVSGEQYYEMLNTDHGVYSGLIPSGTVPGYNELYIRIYDSLGNIYEQKLADAKVTPQFTVTKPGGTDPVEHARVYLMRYNSATQTYEPIELGPAGCNSACHKGLYTDYRGYVNMVLPVGQYRAEVSAVGYKTQSVDFRIGTSHGHVYPTVQLMPEKYGIITAIFYYSSSFMDTLNSTMDYLHDLSRSSRVFELAAFITTLVFVALTLIGFRARTHIPLHSLIDHLLHNRRLSALSELDIVRYMGSVIDAKKSPVARAQIFLIDRGSGRIISHTLTNDRGLFALALEQTREYSIEIATDGYERHSYDIDQSEEIKPVVFKISGHDIVQSARHEALRIITNTIGVGFESFLIGSLVLEIFLGVSFGFQAVIPYLCFSILNLMMWILNRIHVRRDSLLT